MSPVRGDWRSRLQSAVAPLDRGVRGLHVNNFRPADQYALRPGRTAAVLVPVLDLDQPELVLTLRAKHLANHAGQVSFPGGAAEDGDATAVATALREAHEEIGLHPGDVRPVGFLDRFDTISDYRVLPVVGLVSPPAAWKIDASEVDQVFTLPLEVALDRARYQEQHGRHQQQEFVYHSLEWQGHLIWGLTAAMIRNLLDRMESA
ncbi:MAG: CoA pyrophosphatase [Xanthomonadales bacterium]|nr:CoA pyrophosphatase [Xanthomonadales bacterium]